MYLNTQILTAMKKHILLLLVFTAFIASCEKEEPELMLSATQASVLAEGETVTVSVTSNYPWSASAGANWITVSPLSGNPGTTNVTMRVEKNTEHTSRIASVSFTCESVKRSFSVSQSQPLFQQLTIVHKATTFTVPSIIGNGMKALVDFGEGEKKDYENGLTWTYSASGTHRVVIECAGGRSFAMETVAGVSEIDLSSF
jgi:hypothetical protein